MSYIDDWYHTPKDVRLYLEHICEEPKCEHARYLHGYARVMAVGNQRYIEHSEGYCSITGCECKSFHAEPPITKDEVLDIRDGFEGVFHLADLGIAAISKDRCPIVTTRHGGGKAISRMCTLDKGHVGDHKPDFSEGE